MKSEILAAVRDTSGYRQAEAPDVLSVEALSVRRKTSWIGEEVVYEERMDSTNMQAKRLAEQGSRHGTLVVAEQQECGRGRRGRIWESQKGSGIYMSLLLRPRINPEDASMLTLVAAMAVVKSLRETLQLSAEIKWPNDIVLNGKKICGILTEMSAEIDAINYVIIGIGINVSHTEFSKELAAIATSIALESGKRVQRADLIEAVWEQFEYCYEKFIRCGDLSDMVEEYNKLLVNQNRQVHVLDPQKPFVGTSRGITERGELLVEAADGMQRVSSGEVSVRGIYGYV